MPSSKDQAPADSVEHSNPVNPGREDGAAIERDSTLPAITPPIEDEKRNDFMIPSQPEDMVTSKESTKDIATSKEPSEDIATPKEPSASLDQKLSDVAPTKIPSLEAGILSPHENAPPAPTSRPATQNSSPTRLRPALPSVPKPPSIHVVPNTSLPNPQASPRRDFEELPAVLEATRFFTPTTTKKANVTGLAMTDPLPKKSLADAQQSVRTINTDDPNWKSQFLNIFNEL